MLIGEQIQVQGLMCRQQELRYRDVAPGRRATVWVVVIVAGLLLIGNAVFAGGAGPDMSAAFRAGR